MKSQLAVIMFVDIVGYSSMMEQDQGRAIGYVRDLKSTLLEPVAARLGGDVQKRLGDGWIISFGSVSSAVECGMEVLSNLRSHSALKLRIGCHIGEIVQDTDDIYGTGLNIAQRIQAEAPPGGLMVSEDLFRQLSVNKHEGLRDAGIFQLKNIAQPVRLYQWRPSTGQAASVGDATSIAVAEIDFAPSDEKTQALAGDLRDQLVIRMSRRVGVVIFDAAASDVKNATYDLRSRLRVAGDKGRLTLTLVLRADRRPVWSESYDGNTSDIFAFCDVILERAESDLRLQTNAFDGDRLERIPDDDLSVSELRARAANLFYRVTYQDWVHGLALMERAVGLSPTDGVALCMRAESQIMLHAARYEPLPDGLLNQVAEDLDTAVEQAPNSDYVFWTRGSFRTYCLRDIEAARADLERSRNLNPAYAECHELEGHILMLEGKFDESADAFQRLLARQKHNPLMPYRLFLKASALFCAGRFEDAATDVLRAIDVRPYERPLRLLYALACEKSGKADVAEAQRSKADTLSVRPSIPARCPVLPPSHAWLADVLATGAIPD